MKTIRMVVDLEFNEDMWYPKNDTEAREWFLKEILHWDLCQNEPLILHSNEVGDEVGIVKVIEIIE